MAKQHLNDGSYPVEMNMKKAALYVATALAATIGFSGSVDARARNVILVHGAAVDGSTWRAVYGHAFVF